MSENSKRVLILVEDMFNVFEFWYPYYRTSRTPDDLPDFMRAFLSALG